MKLSEGTAAPDFKVLTQKDCMFSLQDHKGKKVVLYFYPKDHTPGCTEEACDFRDAFPHLDKNNVVIIGISKDSLTSHKSFAKKHDLPFFLGADTTEKIIEAYDVLIDKTLYGRPYRGIERTTFLINEEGKIEKIWRPVKVKNHIKEIIAWLNNPL